MKFRNISALLIVVCLALPLSLKTITAQTQQSGDVRELPPGQTFEREMTGAGTHRYKIELQKNEFFQVRVEQKGVDVALKLLDESGKVLATMDSPNGKEGPETLSFVADKAGPFILEVTGANAKSAKSNYSIRRAASHAASPTDRRRIDVERLFTEGLTILGNAPSGSDKTEAGLTKLEEANKGWHELADSEMITLTERRLRVGRLTAQFLVPVILVSEGQKLMKEGTVESLLAARTRFLEAVDAGHRFKQILDEEDLNDVLTKEVKADWKASTIANDVQAFGGVANAYYLLKDWEKSVSYNQMALAVIHEIRASPELSATLASTDRFPIKASEASLLGSIGSTLTARLDKPEQGLKYSAQALAKWEEVEHEYAKFRTTAQEGQALDLQSVAQSYFALGELQKALESCNLALTLFRALGNRRGEATTLTSIGAVYDALGDKQRALDFYNLALPLFRAVGDRYGEAARLNNIGKVYADLGENQKALEFYNQALSLGMAIGDLRGEAATLNNIGRLYELLGEFEKTLEYSNRALALWSEVGSKQGEADTLNNLGSLYSARGDKQKALEFYTRALFSRREIVDVRGEAKALNNIGFLNAELGEKQKARAYYEQALELWRKTDDREGEASTLDNLSVLYETLDEKARATELHDRAMAIRSEINSRAKPTLHVFAIGIDLYRYANKNKSVSANFPLQNLTTAVKDAHDLAAALEASTKGVYDHVATHFLINSTKEEILNALDRVIKEAKSRDTFVFSYSGEGFIWEANQTVAPEYYLMPSDFSPRSGVSGGISAGLLRSLFAKVEAHRKLIIIDAPRAARAVDTLAKSIVEEKTSFSGLVQNDIALVSLSGGPRIDLLSGEGKGHGLLTYALIKGANELVDVNGNEVSAQKLVDYAHRYVKSRLKDTNPTATQIEVKSVFSGEDFPLLSIKASTTKYAHRRNVSGKPIAGIGLTLNNQLQEPQPQKRSSEVVSTTDTALSRAPRVRTGKDYALLIATSIYDHWSALPNPVADAKAIEDELKNYYGFTTETITNPTKAEIVAALKKYKNVRYADDDQLFIFFAGHGTFVDDFREGYIIAKNSVKDDPDASSYLPHSLLRNIIDQIPCRHIFLVIDACFGGTFDERVAKRGDDDRDYVGANNLEFINRKMRFETRQFLTSGGKEYVSDGQPGQHSPFARKVLEALRSYGGTDGILTINRILSYVERVTPEPRRGEWGANEPGSDFIFIAKPK